MQVTVEPIQARGAQTGKPVTPNVQRVRVDGKHEGTVGNTPQSKVMLISSRWTPDEVEEIRRQVASLLGRDVEARKPEPVPDDFFKKSEDPLNDALEVEDFE